MHNYRQREPGWIIWSALSVPEKMIIVFSARKKWRNSGRQMVTGRERDRWLSEIAWWGQLLELIIIKNASKILPNSVLFLGGIWKWWWPRWHNWSSIFIWNAWRECLLIGTKRHISKFFVYYVYLFSGRRSLRILKCGILPRHPQFRCFFTMAPHFWDD